VDEAAAARLLDAHHGSLAAALQAARRAER
jgi:hypothetical protein